MGHPNGPCRPHKSGCNGPDTRPDTRAVLDFTAGQLARRHNGTERADPGCLSAAPPPGQPDQCLSSAPDNTACRPPDPGYSWSHSWLDAWAAETEAARHSLPHLHLLLWLLLPIQVWDLLQDLVSLPSRPPLFIPAALEHSVNVSE